MRAAHCLWGGESYWCVCFARRFSIELLENNQDKLRAAVVLRDKLDYNDKMIYHLQLTATVRVRQNSRIVNEKEGSNILVENS